MQQKSHCGLSTVPTKWFIFVPYRTIRTNGGWAFRLSGVFMMNPMFLYPKVTIHWKLMIQWYSCIIEEPIEVHLSKNTEEYLDWVQNYSCESMSDPGFPVGLEPVGAPLNPPMVVNNFCMYKKLARDSFRCKLIGTVIFSSKRLRQIQLCAILFCSAENNC